MHYRDRSYCSAFGVTCSTAECNRAVTPTVLASARKWWGSDDAPIAYTDLSAGCPSQRPVAE